MSDAEDPPRLAESANAPPELGALLRAAQADSATERELAELASKLGPVLGPNPASPLGPTSSLLAKLGVGAALAVLGLGGLLYARAHHAAPAPVAPSAPGALSASNGGTPASAQPAPAGTSVVDSPPTPATSPTPSAATLPNAGAATRAPAASSHDNGAADSEAALLESARSELSNNPARALALTAEHAKDFPHGILTQEREVIAIAALRRLGRTAEADKRAANFARNFPNSAHQHVVDAIPAK